MTTPRPSWPARPAHFAVDLRELREKVLPDLDEDFIGTLGDFADLDALGPISRSGSSATRSTVRATSSPTRSSTTPSPTRPSSCPPILVDQEVEVMHDEFRGTMARQGITEEAYLKALEKTDADLHAEFRPGAERRVRTLLVLTRVADTEGVDRPRRGRRCRGRAWPRALRQRSAPEEYFESERGRSFIRSSLRRSRVVEGIIDQWLLDHPDHPALPHLEDMPGGAHDHDGHDHDGANATANAAIDATDPGSILQDVPAEDDVPAPAG